MKKLLTILFLIPLLVVGQHEAIITDVMTESKAYKTHFVNDDGTMLDDNYLKASYYQSIDDEMQESILFSYLGSAAMSIRESGIYNFVEKVYDTSTSGNDATQTTESLQPYQYGIAPTERKGMQNPNGDARYITHPEISFAADEPWSVTTCLNWKYQSDVYYSGNRLSVNSLIGLSGDVFRIKNASGVSGYGVNSFYNFVGKNTIVSIIANGSSNVDIYINGLLSESISIVTDMDINGVFFALTGFTATIFNGTISAHIIRNIALDSTQVSNESNFLLSVYPPIAYKTIESMDIATTSLNVVASSNGTVIAEASSNADWATGAARWRYYNDDSEKGSWGNKLYNKASRDVIIANPPEDWHVATEAELTIIADIDGDNLKTEGTDYWTTANGTNLTGFSSVGSGKVNTDGTFTGINTTVGFWCNDSDKALIITDAGAATITTVSANEGYSIRLIKD